MGDLQEQVEKLAEAIEDFVSNTSEPAVARGMMLRTCCDDIALDELISMLAMTEEGE